MALKYYDELRMSMVKYYYGYCKMTWLFIGNSHFQLDLFLLIQKYLFFANAFSSKIKIVYNFVSISDHSTSHDVV